MGCEHLRNPSRLFTNGSRVAISTCRGCLFKTLCLENEKNPVIRNLVLGEEIEDDLFQDEIAEVLADDDKDHAESKKDCEE